MAIMPLHWSVPINNLWKMDQIKMMAFTTQFCRFFFCGSSFLSFTQKYLSERNYYKRLLFIAIVFRHKIWNDASNCPFGLAQTNFL